MQFKIETIFPYKSLYISFWQSSLNMSSFWCSIESKRKSTYFNIQLYITIRIENLKLEKHLILSTVSVISPADVRLSQKENQRISIIQLYITIRIENLKFEKHLILSTVSVISPAWNALVNKVLHWFSLNVHCVGL